MQNFTAVDSGVSTPHIPLVSENALAPCKKWTKKRQTDTRKDTREGQYVVSKNRQYANPCAKLK